MYIMKRHTLSWLCMYVCLQLYHRTLPREYNDLFAVKPSSNHCKYVHHFHVMLPLINTTSVLLFDSFEDWRCLQ